MNPIEAFEQERAERIAQQGDNAAFKKIANDFATEAMRTKYMYNFTSLGRPIIQFPQDMVAAQELIWAVKPDLVIETGIAHGGSLIQTALMLGALGAEAPSPLKQLPSYFEAPGVEVLTREPHRTVLEVDVDVTPVGRVVEQAIATAKLRDLTPTLGVSQSKSTLRQMSLFWGIIPLETPMAEGPLLRGHIEQWALADGSVKLGDRLVFVTGSHLVKRAHNTIVVHEVTGAEPA